MLRDTVHALETGPLAEIGLVAFFIAFLLGCAYAFTLSRRKREDLKHLPLEDDDPVADAEGNGTGRTDASSSHI